MKILFVVPYPLGESPSQRFRFEQYLKILSDAGVRYEVATFLRQKSWRIFYEDKTILVKLRELIIGMLGRLLTLLVVPKYDFIFIHREAAPIGPPVFEWFIAKVFRKKIIYDYDDAIWLTDKKNESRLEQIIRWRSKVGNICKWSYRISAGNAYLEDYARRFNKNVIINPTTIDTENVHKLLPKTVSGEKIVIGWTGSHSTLKYLSELEQSLTNIERKFANVEFWVIADKAPDVNLKRLVFKPWSLQTEVSDLVRFDIGIMPLPNDEWAKGKCGFKALQYMAMGIPTIASAVGVNTTIIKHGINGLLVNSASEWEAYLTQLIIDQNQRVKLGTEGKKSVDKYYSVEANTKTFLSLFDMTGKPGNLSNRAIRIQRESH